MISVSLFGAGRIGRIHADNVAARGDVELRYVVDVDQDAAREFANELDLTFPLVRDDSGNVSSAAFDVRVLPTTIIIDSAGTIHSVHLGPMNDEQIEVVVDELATE